jgi:mono/diheme cytochrome c family protein
MMRKEKSKLILSFFAIIFIAIGSMGGCDGEGGGGNTPFDLADLVRGGLLYDKWWAVNGADEPTDTNPTYPTEQNAMFKDPPRSGSETWRCKECHGWDYLGVDGFYGPPSSHFTGIIGILGATEPQELYDIIADGTTGPTGTMTGYTEDQLSDEDIWDLVKFIKEGLIDDRDYINFDTNEPIDPDLENGQARYDSVCAACHGLGGNAIEFDEGECMRELADDNPVEFFHKVRFGQPGTAMPSSIENGWPTEEVGDVLGYAQTLPPDCEGFPPSPDGDGAQLYALNCAGCHGADATGLPGLGPNIQGETAEEIQDAIDTVPLMSGIDLSPEEIQAIADFLATF